MRSVSVVILHTLIAQVLAQDSSDKLDGDSLVNMFVDKLMDRLKSTQIDDLDGTTLAKPGALSRNDLDDTTLANPALSRGVVTPQLVPRPPMNAFGSSSGDPAIASQVKSIQDKLKTYGVQPSKMQELALTAMAGSQSCSAGLNNPRDVSARAQLNKVYNNAPASVKANSLDVQTGINVKAREMPGAAPPLGFWDPWGLHTLFPDGGGLLFFREAELKHGRVCMLATLGVYVGEKFHPFLGGDIDLPAYRVREMFLETNFQNFWFLGFLVFGILEVTSIRTQYDEPFWEFNDLGNFRSSGFEKKDRLPGDLGFDPLSLKPTKPKELYEMQTKEILNGRLAMIAFVGMMAQELATGEKIFN